MNDLEFCHTVENNRQPYFSLPANNGLSPYNYHYSQVRQLNWRQKNYFSSYPAHMSCLKMYFVITALNLFCSQHCKQSLTSKRLVHFITRLLQKLY